MSNWVENKTNTLLRCMNMYAAKIGVKETLALMLKGHYVFKPEGFTDKWACDVINDFYKADLITVKEVGELLEEIDNHEIK